MKNVQCVIRLREKSEIRNKTRKWKFQIRKCVILGYWFYYLRHLRIHSFTDSTSCTKIIKTHKTEMNQMLTNIFLRIFWTIHNLLNIEYKRVATFRVFTMHKYTPCWLWNCSKRSKWKVFSSFYTIFLDMSTHFWIQNIAVVNFK